MEVTQSIIKGHLDIYVAQNNNNENEVFINGDPTGLRSLADALVNMANIIEEEDYNLNIGDREHIRLNPNMDLSKSSDPLTIGRLEAKLTGNFYERYIPRDSSN